MALKNLDAETLMQDAREAQAEGVRLMDAGIGATGRKRAGWPSATLPRPWCGR